MKNFKTLSFTVSIDYIYCLLTFFFSFVVIEYVHDIFTDFSRFKLMHSLTDNIYFGLIFIAWVLFTICIIKYNHKTIKIKIKKYLIAVSCAIILLIVGWLLIDNLNNKPPRLYLSSEFSKTVQAISDSYSWSNGNKSVMADSIHPTEFQYTTDNTLTIPKNEQLILSNKKIKIDRRYPFELLNLECFDNNKTVIDYQVLPTYSNGDLYIKTPSVDGIYICSAVLKYKRGVASYSYKLIVADNIAKFTALYENKTSYVGNNSKVSAIANNLTVPTQLSWGGIELQTEKEPYGLTINYLITEEDFKKIDLNSAQDTFKRNAIIMFSLIGNVENITINLKQGEKVTTYNYSRKMADDYTKQDVWNLSQTEDSFITFLFQLYSNEK